MDILQDLKERFPDIGNSSTTINIYNSNGNSIEFIENIVYQIIDENMNKIHQNSLSILSIATGHGILEYAVCHQLKLILPDLKINLIIFDPAYDTYKKYYDYYATTGKINSIVSIYTFFKNFIGFSDHEQPTIQDIYTQFNALYKNTLRTATSFYSIGPAHPYYEKNITEYKLYSNIIEEKIKKNNIDIIISSNWQNTDRTEIYYDMIGIYRVLKHYIYSSAEKIKCYNYFVNEENNGYKRFKGRQVKIGSVNFEYPYQMINSEEHAQHVQQKYIKYKIKYLKLKKIIS